MILVRINHLEFTTESNKSRLSIIRFYSRHHVSFPSPADCVVPLSSAKTYLAALLEQDLVVLAQGHAEDDGRHVFEAVDPLLSFAPLAAHIEHATGFHVRQSASHHA